jgi:hypothetical protein
MNLQTIRLHMTDGSHHEATGPRLRLRIEGRYRYFVVHPSPEFPDAGYFSVTEVQTGKRVCTIGRFIKQAPAAKKAAQAKLRALLKQGIGPQIHQQIEANLPSK